MAQLPGDGSDQQGLDRVATDSKCTSDRARCHALCLGSLSAEAGA
jgi:hypothetical protein